VDRQDGTVLNHRFTAPIHVRPFRQLLPMPSISAISNESLCTISPVTHEYLLRIAAEAFSPNEKRDQREDSSLTNDISEIKLDCGKRQSQTFIITINSSCSSSTDWHCHHMHTTNTIHITQASSCAPPWCQRPLPCPTVSTTAPDASRPAKYISNLYNESLCTISPVTHEHLLRIAAAAFSPNGKRDQRAQQH
jgi:hypothetical protein